MSSDICSRSIQTKSGETIDVVSYLGRQFQVSREPYRLDDAQGSFERYLSKEGYSSKDIKLKPTHHALKVQPQSIDQLYYLENDRNLIVLYAPFGYNLLYDTTRDNSDICNYKSLDVNDVIDCCNTDMESNEIKVYPVYILWPVSKQIPDQLSYEYCYEAFFPEQNTEKSDPIISDWENEAFFGALDRGSSITGTLRVFDNRLNEYVPVPHALLRYSSYDWETTLYQMHTARTLEDGSFSIERAIHPTTPLELILTNDKFVIRDSLTSNIKTISLGSVLGYQLQGNPVQIDLPVDFFLDVYNAADYYFYGENDLLDQVEKYDTLGTKISIYAIDTPGVYLGVFNYASTPYINIWNYYKSNYTGASSKVFGTVNHELGHATNYARYGKTYTSQTPSFIKESFASFFGWYNVSQYYSSVASSHSIVHSICTQGRQSWTTSSSNLNYTPIYIDLFDDYNQQLYNSSHNYDTIDGVPIDIILSLSLGPQSMGFISSLMQYYASTGLYFTYSQYTSFIAPYSIFY